jgi:hypothetical protein
MSRACRHRIIRDRHALVSPLPLVNPRHDGYFWHVADRSAGIHFAFATTQPSMVTLRVVRHDRHEQVLAECQSTVLPDRGEVLQLDTIDASGEMTRPSTLWRVVSVTVHIPSIASSRAADGTPPMVKTVEVTVLPDISLVPEFAAAAEKILSESKM